MITPEVFAVAMVIDSTIILEKEKVYCTVELKGEYTKGLMIVDRRGYLHKPPNLFVVRNMDLGKTQALFGAIFTTPEMSEPLSPVSLAGPVRDHVPVLFKETRMNIV